MTTTAAPEGRREAKKAATRRRLHEAGMRLFAEQGYEATTVEQIAAAAGVSHMTFFRYFPSKDHLVLTEEYDPLLVDQLRSRPDDEPAVEMVRAALLATISAIYPHAKSELLQRWTLVSKTPALLALQEQRSATAQQLVVEGLASHPDHGRNSLHTQVTASICLSAATTASLVWARRGGTDSLLDLMGEAFDVIRSA
jgi:AcrR family transcriptional regulator